VNYHTWCHNEDVLDSSTHEAYQKDLDAQWHSRFSEQQHHDLVQNPGYLNEDARTLSGVNVCTRVDDVTLSADEKEAKLQEMRAQLQEEATDFKKKYYADFQSIFSRVQHHMHKKTKKGHALAAVVQLNTCDTIATQSC